MASQDPATLLPLTPAAFHILILLATDSDTCWLVERWPAAAYSPPSSHWRFTRSMSCGKRVSPRRPVRKGSYSERNG